MTDLTSILGYSKTSPFRGNPYLDISSPEGLIDMSQTDMDLVGIDNLGNTKRMKAGRKKPYKFPGNVIREIPMGYHQMPDGTIMSNDEMKKGGKLTPAQYNTIRGLKDAHGRGDFDNISPNKARRILHAKKLFGKPLTPEQYKLFGYLSKGNTLNYMSGGLSPEKAHEMLKDDTAHGRPLTAKQKRYFGMIYGNSKKQSGGYAQEWLKYLFEEDTPPVAAPQTQQPTDSDYLNERERDLDRRAEELDDQESYNLALSIAMQTGENPYEYKGKTTSTIGANPYAVTTGKELLSQFNLSNLGIWGDLSHSLRKSDHNTGDAQDFGVKDPIEAQKAIAKLQQEASQKNVKYIIYNGKIWNPSISNEWRPYSGKDPHKTHFHVSYNR